MTHHPRVAPNLAGGGSLRHGASQTLARLAPIIEGASAPGCENAIRRGMNWRGETLVRPGT